MVRFPLRRSVILDVLLIIEHVICALLILELIKCRKSSEFRRVQIGKGVKCRYYPCLLLNEFSVKMTIRFGFQLVSTLLRNNHFWKLIGRNGLNGNTNNNL